MSVLDSFSLAGKNAIVTGASRGIGKSLAMALAEAGADVITVARNGAQARETADAVTQLGRKALAIEADITTDEGIAAVIDGTVAEFGRIDILVNNAGYCIHKPSLEVTREEYREVLDINLEAVFFLSQAAAQQMARQGQGNIVNIGSISAMIVNRPQWQASYNASKAGVHQLTKSFAAEWAPLGIRVNAIAPGYIKTDMAMVDDPRFKARWIDDSAQQRYAHPEDLGTTMVYLASEGSGFMTGSVTVIDGGYTLY
jgi:NAD(P)-dependent dehydrogenase (short-subunit alcohol dehydrogenase family)